MLASVHSASARLTTLQAIHKAGIMDTSSAREFSRLVARYRHQTSNPLEWCVLICFLRPYVRGSMMFAGHLFLHPLQSLCLDITLWRIAPQTMNCGKSCFEKLQW